MKKDEDPLSISLATPAKDLLIDFADIGLDELMGLIKQSSEVLEKVPFVKWFFIANDVRTILQSAFFLRKYANFIGPIRESVQDDEAEIAKLKSLYENDKKYRKVIEYSIIEVDRYQTEFKAKLLGVLYVKTFLEKVYSVEEYNLMLFSIENIHPFSGIECFRHFYEYRKSFDEATNEDLRRLIWSDGAKLDYSPLANTGFLNLPQGGAFAGNLGGASLNELGKSFYENVVINVAEE